ncbi:GDSL-type esterase/lipase family protein [Nocardiopsis alborubida]|uniref:Fibronectin type-III domain-containing protein n=1 Tax=Nocardiopsis alborubida TaxID=146802 RepID=A0A7X6RSS2_9ACTN|nr:GDSL-type esterase/lipase family protein [Nocardiopsis alborubida]NKZ01275.1 hypothetical protein [Nocardiopsis alborubida]
MLASLLVSVPSATAEEETTTTGDIAESAAEHFSRNPPEPPVAPPTPEFGDADKVVPAWERGELSTDEMVEYGLFNAISPERLPGEYQPEPGSTLPFEEYVTFVLSHMDEASESTREWVDDYVSPHTPGEEGAPRAQSNTDVADCYISEVIEDQEFLCVSSSAHFRVYYNVGSSGVPETDTSPTNGKADSVDTILESLESAYNTYLGMGLEHEGEGPIAVVLGLAPQGSAVVPPGIRINGAPTIWLSADPAELSDGRYTNRYSYLPRHELYHVFQYNYFTDALSVGGTMNWWMEATAEWATHESLRSGVGANLYASSLDQFLGHPERALNAHDGLSEERQYGAFILASYLTEAVSRNFVLDTWRVMDDAGTPVAAIQYAANYYGRGMDELLLGFAVSNYRLERYTNMTFALGARDGYNDAHAGSVWQNQLVGGRPARTERSLSWGSSTSGTAQVGPGGATYVELTSQGGGRGRLIVNVTASSDFRYTLFTSRTTASGRPDMVPLEHSQEQGNGQVVVSVGEGETATLVATRTTLIQDSGDAESDRAGISWNARLTSSGSGDNIMVVGDSITHGNEGSHSWRFALDRHLDITGETVDFVGPRVGAYDIYTDIRNRAILDGQDPPPQEYYPGPSTARYMNNDFDRDHNAMWGWTFADANNTIQRDVEQHDADYLLIALGFNDITWGYSDASGTVASARRMVTEARAANPDIKILISNVVTRTPLPGFEWLNGEIREYGNLLEGAVSDLSTSRSPVHLVDISSGFDPYDHAWDGLHPNTQGDYFIASKFADALHEEFGMGAPYGNIPSPLPDVELEQVDWVSAGVTDQGFRLSWAREFGASGYYIWTRDATLAEPWELLPLPAPGDYFRSTWVRDGHTYEFRVAPVRGDQVGPISQVASAVAEPKTLPGPSNVTARVEGRDVLVEWDHRSGATGYRVYWIEAVGDYPVMRHEYVGAGGDDRYRIQNLTPGMTYNVGVSTVNYYGPGIPTGVLNDVTIPGTLTAQEAEAVLETAWTPGTEALEGLQEPWEGYPEGAAPIVSQIRAAELTEDLLGPESPGVPADERVVDPVAPRREEDE